MGIKNIGFFGDGIWAQNSLKKILLDKTFTVKFICCRYKNPDKKLIKIGKKNSITILSSKNINQSNFIKKIKNFNCDIFVSMSFNQIFKQKIINIPRSGIINCHAGKLPFYRGRSILNWAIINNEIEFGITVHFVDIGIDTGDIILQKTFPIKKTDNYGTILNRALLYCPKILYKALKSIQKDNYLAIKQNSIDKKGSYFKRRLNGDELINWNQSSLNLFNFIRALYFPGPLALTFINDRPLKIIKAEISNQLRIKKIYKPGQIVKINAKSFVVKTLDGFIKVKSWKFKKIKLRIGDKFK